jgi:hypothetical protein
MDFQPQHMLYLLWNRTTSIFENEWSIARISNLNVNLISALLNFGYKLIYSGTYNQKYKLLCEQYCSTPKYLRETFETNCQNYSLANKTSS